MASAFGWVHGFGFANTLLELELPTTSLVTALIGFNRGVEVGHLAVIAAIPALAGSARPWAAAALVLATGSFWMIWRALA